MDLPVEAQAEGTLVLSGARPGIDGSYRIVSVTHKETRSGGATTSLELKQPTGGAGNDGRKAG
jgi:phage protein D